MSTKTTTKQKLLDSKNGLQENALQHERGQQEEQPTTHRPQFHATRHRPQGDQLSAARLQSQGVRQEKPQPRCIRQP